MVSFVKLLEYVLHTWITAGRKKMGFEDGPDFQVPLDVCGFSGDYDRANYNSSSTVCVRFMLCELARFTAP